MSKKNSDSPQDNEAAKIKALEDKVDAYMNPSEPEPTQPQQPASKPEIVSEPEKSSAPLLPSEKLPDLAKPKKSSNIEVVDHSKEPEVIPPAADQPAEIKDELGLEDVGMGKAIDEIIAAEADEVLEAEDKKHEPPAPTPAPSFGQKIRHFFALWWHNKLYRNSTIGLLIAAVLAAGLVPTTRYALLNTAGVRASASMTVLDDKTGLPLKNVELTMSGQAAKTDVSGRAKLEKVKLGSQNLSIKKPAFAEINQKIIIGWGSNPRGEVRLTPVGSQFKFKVTDFLSGKPVNKVEVIAGEASALSNEQGEIILTVPETSEEDLSVQINGDGYRTEKTTVSTANKQDINVQLVPARKHAFIS
jgi:hypothetical protein